MVSMKYIPAIILCLLISCGSNSVKKESSQLGSAPAGIKTRFQEGTYVINVSGEKAQRDFKKGQYERKSYTDDGIFCASYGHYIVNDSVITILFDSAYGFDSLQNRYYDSDFMIKQTSGWELYYRYPTNISIEFYNPANNSSPASWRKWDKIK